MSKIEEPTIEVKLFVDKEKKKVLFAESDKEFVDVLFSFLTMPLGTIVRLMGKQSQIGCLDQIYKSVEDLSSDYFQTKACRTMLLAPLNAASSHCSRLKINVDDTKNREVYVCKDTGCCAHRAFSSVPDSACKCGKLMESSGQSPDTIGEIADGAGVFVNGCLKFITTDDFQVAPASTSLMMSLFEKLGVRDPANLEQKVLHLTSEKITGLLKRSLASKQPLTGLYFDDPMPYNDSSQCVLLPQNLNPETVTDNSDTLDNMKIRVVQMKNNSTLLYAEAGNDFVDLFFGLLSIPLGSIIKSLDQRSSNGCLDNLYRSIDGSCKGCMISERQSLLLAPTLAPFFGCCTSKILQADESVPKELNINVCFTCFKKCGFLDLRHCHEIPYNPYLRRCVSNCQETVKSTKLCELNPKSPNDGSENGEAYVKAGDMKFVVTNDLNVHPLSLSTTLQIVSDAKIEMEKLVEKEITLTKCQIMGLLRAVLMSRNALGSVLLPPKKKKLSHLRY
ncbi:hypothetical protein EJB05_39462, partial [Eragrostis curvula]